MAEAISSDVIRGYNDTMILSILRQAPSYGYEISKRIRAVTEGKYIIKETTLYSAFARLEKNGHIESYEADDGNDGRKRTWYRITAAGAAYYREKCEEWELTKDVVQRFIEGSEAIEDKKPSL